MNWPAKKLGEVCELVGDSLNPQEFPGETFAHYSIPAFDEQHAPVLEEGTAILSNKIEFLAGAVLFSKLNPRIARVWHVNDRRDERRICSTEFLPLMPGSELVAEFLVWVLQSPTVIRALRSKVAAATKSRERLKPEQVMEQEIPLPPLDEQRKIVKKLDAQMGEVEKMRVAVDARIEAARALPSSFLRTVFNSPESQTWLRPSLRDLLIENGQYGLSVKASYSTEGLPMLRMGNILTTGRIDWSDVKNVSLPDQEMSSYLLSRGDILFNRTNSAELVGKTAVFDGVQPAVFASYLVRFRVDSEKADARFVTAYINSEFGRRFIEQHMARAVGQVNISASTMHAMPIPTPSLLDQRRIVARLDEQMAHADALIRALESEREAIAALPAALLREVFE